MSLSGFPGGRDPCEWRDHVNDDDMYFFALLGEEQRLMVRAAAGQLSCWRDIACAQIPGDRLAEIQAMQPAEAQQWCEDRILEQRRLDVAEARQRRDAQAAAAPQPPQLELAVGAMFDADRWQCFDLTLSVARELLAATNGSWRDSAAAWVQRAAELRTHPAAAAEIRKSAAGAADRAAGRPARAAVATAVGYAARIAAGLTRRDVFASEIIGITCDALSLLSSDGAMRLMVRH